jgi:CBS domain-containing protein
MLCQNIMQHPVRWISEGDTAQTAARVMRDENIGFLPVCDASGRVVGVVTDRDIAVRLVAGDLPAGTHVSVIMSKEVFACRADDEVTRAEREMSRHHKSRIVCTNDTGHLVGIISMTDIAKHDDGWRVARTLRKITEREAR